MSTTDEENDKTFKKRFGTTDVGKDYEDLVAANLILKLIDDNNIQDFYLSSNDDKYGIFDDVVLEIKTASREERKYAMQLKHVGRGNLQESALTNVSGNFSIQKYFKEYKKLDPQAIKSFKLILYTNLKFEIPDEGKMITLDGKQIQIKISYHEIFEEFEDGICYKFEVINESQDADEYKLFFQQFFLCTNQPNVKKIEDDTLQKFRKMFRCERIFGEKFLNFVTKWSKQEGKKTKLNKIFMQQAMAVHLLTPSIKPFSFSEEIKENKKISLLKQSISEFKVTIISEKYGEYIQTMWNDLKNQSEGDEKTLMKKGRDFQVIPDTTSNNMERTKLLWLSGKCPLVLMDNETTHRAINLCQNGNFIVLEEDSCRDNLRNGTIFENLADFETNSPTYRSILETFKCSLQGKNKISLKILISQNEKIRKNITTNQLIQMLDDSLVIGEREENLPDPYINRVLTKRHIGPEFFRSTNEDTLIVISCLNRFDKIVKHIDGLQIIKIKNKNLQSEPSKRIYIDDDQCSREDFNKICEENPEIKEYYHFKIIDDDGRLECIDDKGTINENVHLEDKTLINCEAINKINVIYGDSGIGKSVLNKFLKNNSNSKFWTVLVSVKDYSLYFAKKDCDVEHFLDYLSTKTNNFDQKIFKLFEETGRITVLWDGLDEISTDNLEIVLEIIKKIEERGLKQWISCSYNVLEIIEKKLDVFSLRIRPFSEIQLIKYIENRLKEADFQEKKSIKNSMEMVQYNDILGTSVQIFMLTELFRQNPGKSKSLVNEVFSVTSLYSNFIDEELKSYYSRNQADEAHFEEWKTKQIQNYERAALETIFGIDTLEELNISWDEEDDCADILIEIDDKRPEFFHFSYLEYFAATYIYKNFKSSPELRRILSEKKYKNIRFMFDLLLTANSPPHLATLYNNLDLLKRYQGQLDTCKDQLLQIAAFWGDGYIEITKFLIESGANINSSNEDGSTPLHLSCTNGHIKTVRLLINNRNTVLNPIDKNGDPPIRTSYKNGYFKIVRLLLLCPGIDKNGADLNGSRLIHLACEDGHDEVVKLLLLSEGVKVNAADKEGSTPILLATKKGRVDAVRALLLSTETDVNAADKDGARPIHLACMMGHSEIVRVLLLSPKIDVNPADYDGSRAIHMVAERGNSEIVRMLVMCPNILKDAGNKYGKTPQDLASERGFTEVVRLLTL